MRRKSHKLARAIEEADSIRLQQIDRAAAVPRPSAVSKFHSENEYKAHGKAQFETYTADGETRSRPHLVRAASRRRQAKTADQLRRSDKTVVAAALEELIRARHVLGPLVRRDRLAFPRYVLALFFLCLGDTAGILGAAITLGEVPYIAFGQALATGFAAVAAGQAGSDLKDLRLARQRQRDDLTEDERRYRHYFTGIEAGVSIMKVLGCLSLTIVLIISGGIFCLRLSVEGMTSGIAFGALAAATALGSFVSTYSYTDEIADYLARVEKIYRKAITTHRKLAADPAIRESAEALASATIVRAEHQHRGRAAWWQIRSLSHRILRQNPGVAGHGTRPEQPEVIGRRVRGDAA